MTITNNKIYRGIRCISNSDVCFDGYKTFTYRRRSSKTPNTTSDLIQNIKRKTCIY